MYTLCVPDVDHTKLDTRKKKDLTTNDNFHNLNLFVNK